MQRFLSSLLLLVVFLPVVALAHPDHDAGAPPHPVDSPQYHEISAPAETDVTQLSLLRQLVALLQQQLAILLGLNEETQVDTPVVDDAVTFCTQDAMQCPDGTWVGRSGPDCAFVCPDVDTTSAASAETTGSLTMTTDGVYRYFSSDGLPEYSISGNRYANTATAQSHEFRVPLAPIMNTEPTYYNIPFTFGIALNGVTFEPFAAEWYQNDRTSGWQEDPFVTFPDLDDNNAHVQPGGLYHYHGLPENLVTGEVQQLIGFAADGFPVYAPFQDAVVDGVGEDGELIAQELVEPGDIASSYQLKSGTRPSGPGGTYDGTYNEDYEYVAGSGPLDECNGRFGITREYPVGTYYYTITRDFPYVPRCLMGDMDPSFVMTPGAGRR